MLTVTSNVLELRGISNKTTKSGTVYYVVNTEAEDGTPFGFYCPDSSAFPNGLKKGDMVNVIFEVTYFDKKERLVVRQVCKAVD